MSNTASMRLLCGLGLAASALIALLGQGGIARADKVGVAAAVNPDAFSSLEGSAKTQLNIGKSIFFNERINTTGSGLVQVLLVDGSTFTVGPGSDLVIDKFVYDPNKKTGEIAASFSKGVMRFVGGKISKNEGAVTVDTPAGALAIRGGMFQTNGKVYSFLFGEHMTLTGRNGQTYTVFQPGNSIDTTSGVPTIRPTTTADVNAIMAALTPGGNVGTGTPNTPPSPGTGAQQAALNNLASELITEATSTQINGDINSQEKQDVTNATPTGTPDTPGGPTGTPGTPDNPPPVQTVELPAELSMRVLTAPDFYIANQSTFHGQSFGGVPVLDPGDHGIVGGEDQKIPCLFGGGICGDHQYFFQVQTDDFNVNSDSIADGRMQGTIEPLIEFKGIDSKTHLPIFGFTPTAQYNFPIFNTPGVHSVTDATVTDTDGKRTLVGVAFTGSDGGFFAYQLFGTSEDGKANLNDPVLAFGGETFTKPENEPNQLRLFQIYSDPRQGIAVPFAIAATAPKNLNNLPGLSVSPLYLLENSAPVITSSLDNNLREGPAPKPSVWVQTSYLVSGTGPNQQSILVLALGEQNADGQLTGVRRGTTHINIGTATDPNMQTVNLTGALATLAGPKDQNGQTPYLFGKTVPHFVIGADSTGPGHNLLEDQPLNPQAFSGGGPNAPSLSVNDSNVPPASSFLGATYHVGEQVASVDTATLTKTTGDVSGFAAGLYQQTPNGDDPTIGKLMNSTPDGVHILFKDDNRLSAQFLLKTGDGGGANLKFGDWYNSHGDSAFINDKIYAAVDSSSQPSTVTVQYGPYHVPRTADASTYLVSVGLLDLNAKLCNGCDFLKWGTWGGQLKFRDGSQYGLGSNVTADVNLGWYVTGNVATVGQLPIQGTASYSGSTIGNVAAFQNNVWNTYVATGGANMTWDFGHRNGTFAITNFDAHGPFGPLNINGDIIAPGEVAMNSLNRFSGNSLTGTLGSVPASGAVNGAFVNAGTDIAKGAIGNWNAISGSNYQATGIFGAGRTSSANIAFSPR